MTPIESKYTQLRKLALAHYNAVIWPATAEEFDAINPRPRIALNVELERIAEKERKEGGRGW